MEGAVELLQLEAKLKIPTDGGNPGPYNGRSYDGLYLLKGGGKQAWKLFPRIIKAWSHSVHPSLGTRTREWSWSVPDGAGPF